MTYILSHQVAYALLDRGICNESERIKSRSKSNMLRWAKKGGKRLSRRRWILSYENEWQRLLSRVPSTYFLSCSNIIFPSNLRADRLWQPISRWCKNQTSIFKIEKASDMPSSSTAIANRRLRHYFSVLSSHIISNRVSVQPRAFCHHHKEVFSFLFYRRNPIGRERFTSALTMLLTQRAFRYYRQAKQVAVQGDEWRRYLNAVQHWTNRSQSSNKIRFYLNSPDSVTVTLFPLDFSIYVDLISWFQLFIDHLCRRHESNIISTSFPLADEMLRLPKDCQTRNAF